MSRTIAVIQARLSSTRLPGKALMEVAGRPLIGHLVDRLRHVRGLDGIGVAIGDATGNEPLIDFAESEHLPWVVGPEEDVLARFKLAAREFKAEVILRATPDCPLWAPDLGGQVLAALRSAGAEYAHNTRPGVDGFDTEVFTRDALEECPPAFYPEHVTMFLRQHSRAVHVQQAPELWHLKLSVDTPEDLERVRTVMERVGARPDRWTSVLLACWKLGLA